MNDKPVDPPRGQLSRLTRNIVASLLRVGATGLVALALPAYLTSRLPISIYGAWVLILQLGAYVSFLDLGIQTGVAKFVAEYEARGDLEGAGRHASAGLAMTSVAALAGVLLTCGLAWQVPHLFQTMPIALYGEVRASVLLVGLSLCITLACSIFPSVFIGLQRYTVPMVLVVASRTAFAIVVCVTVLLHGSLLAMATGAAIVNLLVAGAQIYCWRRLAANIQIRRSLIQVGIVRRMVSYCVVLAVWSIGMLCVNGLDVTIVGHFDFRQTGFYSIAVMPTNLILLIISSIMGPMMPASSALSTRRTPAQMGSILTRTTRYVVILLLLSGLPLVVFGFPILKLWVGAIYAAQSIYYLRILVIANVVRNLCLPYATMVVATGKQRSATIATVSEAVVNLGCSIYLASRIGAVGVAYGTLIGAVVSVSLHFLLSMPATSDTLYISRWRMLFQGMLRPAAIGLPSLLLYLTWTSMRLQQTFSIAVLTWFVTTVLLAWVIGLNKNERKQVLAYLPLKH